MYERSAIVLEKYIENVLRLNKTYNLKLNTENYESLVYEIEKFQMTINKDLKVIQEFDDTVKTIEEIQKEQERLYKINKKLEEDRVHLFGELGEDVKVLESKLQTIEIELEKNNERIKELRERFIQNLKDFSEKQKDRNKCDKERRVSEARIIKYKEDINAQFKEIDVKDVVNLKDFISSEKEQVRQEALSIMIKNGKNEKIPFNQDVLRKAINNRIDIAEKEAECYIIIFDKMKKLLMEADSETTRLDKYKKSLRDISIKLAFLNAQKEYIVGFLDYERMAIISGSKVHKKMMSDACNNFELDMMQIKKLYELILKEIANKATQKAYKDLYNKNYLKNIEDKEKNFEEEANNVNLKMGTLINSNYWRIEGIKNIYMVFQDEVSKKFNRDLTEYRIEELDEQDDSYDNIEDNAEIYQNYQEEYDEEYDDEEYDEEEYDEEEYDDEYQEEHEQQEEYEEYEEYEDDYEQQDDDEDEENIVEEEQYNENYEQTEYEESDTIQDNLMEEFDSEDIDSIIKNSRKKSSKKATKVTKQNKSNGKETAKKLENNKGLFNKLFKK